MRTELTSPVTDIATPTGAPSPIAKPHPAAKLQEQQSHVQAKPVQDKPARTAVPSVAVAISIDEDRNTIYRFLDQRTGVLIRQVPPEEVLRVMRNINEMLQASEQKVKVDA